MCIEDLRYADRRAIETAVVVKHLWDELQSTVSVDSFIDSLEDLLIDDLNHCARAKYFRSAIIAVARELKFLEEEEKTESEATHAN